MGMRLPTECGMGMRLATGCDMGMRLATGDVYSVYILLVLAGNTRYLRVRH